MENYFYIFIEILNLLKNKQVKGNAKEMLQKLHGECLTLGNSLSVISHVLGMGKIGHTGKRKSLVGQNRPVSNERQKANNVEIIEWLAEITEVERSMKEIDPIKDENLAFYFLVMKAIAMYVVGRMLWTGYCTLFSMVLIN